MRYLDNFVGNINRLQTSRVNFEMKSIKPIKIGARLVAPGQPPYVIFEVASTHGKNWEAARNYVYQAKKAGADAVKFQLFRTNKLLNPILPDLKSTYEYFKKVETPKEWIPKLKKLSDKIGIDFLCTPFDEDSATYLNNYDIPAIKIASGDLTHYKLLQHVAKFGKPVILSTGVAMMHEVEKSVEILRKAGCRELAVLQCVSVYPMPYEAANVRVMETFQKKLNAVVGYSDNGSKGILVPLVANALGASIIEKHVTSQKNRGSMDDVFSMSIKEFNSMTKRIRQKKSLQALRKEFGKDVNVVLGNGKKEPTSIGVRREGEIIEMNEIGERLFVRRGIYPRRTISKETKITSDMLIALRPNIGVSASDWNSLVGKTASENLVARQPIKLEGARVAQFTKQEIQLLVEFYSLKFDPAFKKLFDAIVVLSAEEVELIGENKKRLQQALTLLKDQKKNPILIFLGTKTHDKYFNHFVRNKVKKFISISNRKEASTKTQIKDLVDYLKKHLYKKVLIVSHAYHIPRIRRYCQKYIPSSIHYDFCPVGNIAEQEKQIRIEIKKIIKYKAQGHL